MAELALFLFVNTRNRCVHGQTRKNRQNSPVHFFVFGGGLAFFPVREHRQKQVFAVFMNKEGIFRFVFCPPNSGGVVSRTAVSDVQVGTFPPFDNSIKLGQPKHPSAKPLRPTTKPAEPSDILMISVDINRLTISIVTKVFFESSGHSEQLELSSAPFSLVLRSRPYKTRDNSFFTSTTPPSALWHCRGGGDRDRVGRRGNPRGNCLCTACAWDAAHMHDYEAT